MISRPRWRTIGIVLFVIVASLVVRNQVKIYLRHRADDARRAEVVAIRQRLFDELRPVALAKCELKRFGEPHDGGYMLCGNLLDGVQSGYSYGISGYDGWGCDVSTQRQIPVHQYDCFNTDVPVCKRGKTIFHPECVGPGAKTEEGRKFDSIAGQLERNGDGKNHVVLKIDVEGAEWESFLATPDDVFRRIDQMVIEFHGFKEQQFVDVVRHLKRHFHVAHYHANNFSCDGGEEPFTSWAYEVLMVNKQLDTEDSAKTPPGLLLIDAPNNPKATDCQPRR